MRTTPQSAARWICVGLALICLIALVPTSALADTDLDVGGQAHIAYANGDAVRLRYGPGYSNDVLDMIPEGTTVDVLDGPFWAADDSVWYKIDVDGEDGYLVADYLAAGPGSGEADTSDTSTADASTADSSDSSAYDDGTSGTTEYTTDGLNLRTGPSYDNDVILVMPAGAEVTRTGQSANGFASVDYQGTEGWAVTDYLSSDPPADTSTASADSNSGSGESAGQAMVDFAMQYLGYPYVWATHGPDTFDCSGFTYWVVMNVLGEDIGTGTAGQIGYGTPVDESNLQPGDLVFFQNTFEAGISHVGIYIGGGQFIHAENPSTGVVISDLSDPYYTEHYYGAIRLV